MSMMNKPFGDDRQRTFDTGATRDTDAGKLDYEGFLSPLVLERYQDYVFNQQQIAWAAGLFEGEGCIRLNKERGRIRKDGSLSRPEGYFYPRLVMLLTDEDVLRKFVNIIGGNIKGPYVSKNKLSKKPQWMWQAQGELALNIAKLFTPYLGCRRFAKLYEVFGVQKSAEICGLDPLIIESYGKYLNKHRVQSDGKLRDSDNWQKGIPKKEYIKSAFRHFIDFWKEHRGIKTENGIEDAICAVLFNVSGYLHELLKEKE